MRFSVDAHAIGCHLTGNEVYIRNLLQEFPVLDPQAEFTAYLSMEGAPAWIPGRVAREWVSKNPFRRLGFDLPRKLLRSRPDLIHVQYTAPLYCPVPVVVSVHDVSFLEHPEYFTRFRSLQLRLTVHRTVRSAARVLTPSEFSRQAILDAYGLDPRKVVVVPNGVSSTFRPVLRETALSRIQSRFHIPGPFILTVGDLQPRKNHVGLIRAFEDLLRANPQLPHRLVMVGKNTWYTPEVRRAAAASPVAGRIHFAGFVEDEDLLHFYGACDLFVFPSFYEGFGLPILEAMACGRAVACSNTSAMPEVANAAGLLFDPHSTREMTRAMEDLLLDTELRTRTERLGGHHAALYSWRETARKTLDVYYEVAGAGTRAAAGKARRVSAGGRG
ncbi:MAG: glycosyltransferase family 1 protein [Bryobacteraceae bacterium]